MSTLLAFKKQNRRPSEFWFRRAHSTCDDQTSPKPLTSSLILASSCLIRCTCDVLECQQKIDEFTHKNKKPAARVMRLGG